MVIQIKRGLDLPISGLPRQKIIGGAPVSKVALISDDYVGMKPTMLVKEGDRVKLGEPVFTDKKTEGVTYTAPGAGRVIAINRGAKRKFESLEIELDGDQEITFKEFSDLQAISSEQAREQLTQSGLWTALRTRPYGKVPSPESTPHSIFVTAIDTHPLAGDPEVVIDQYKDFFISGLMVLTRFGVPVHLCVKEDADIAGDGIDGVTKHEFSGPHPAGLVGTHIHYIDPVGPGKTVWHLNYQDVIAIGHLFVTGRLMTDRTVSIAGPLVAEPKLYTTRLGACLEDLVVDLIDDQEIERRIVSGSVLSGRTSQSPVNYLGRFHLQVTVLAEGSHREFLGWQRPGLEKYSVSGAFVGSWLGRYFGKRFAFNTNTNGSKRAMVPIGSYEKVMPLDILPTQLLRALISRDTEEAQALGCLELDEEDLSLCTYCCPGKYEYGSILRENLTQIEKEG